MRGPLEERKLASAMQQAEVPGPKGPIKVNFVTAQFETAFENLIASPIVTGQAIRTNERR